jgi:hypothetical protein
MCDYVPTVEVGHHALWERGPVAAGARVRIDGGYPVGVTARGYWCHVHRDLGELGQIRAGAQVARELAADPLLADGMEVPG